MNTPLTFVNPGVCTETPGAKAWFATHCAQAFPIEKLPPKLAGTIVSDASRFGVSYDFLATTALALLGGIAAENTELKSWSGTAMETPVNVIVAVPQEPAFEHALRGQLEVIRDIQAKALQRAASLNRERTRRDNAAAPVPLVDGISPGICDPNSADEARMHDARVAEEPMLWLEAPGARELRNAFAGSHDRSLMVTDSGGEIVRRLIAAQPSREDRKLAALLARLSRGGHLDIPALKLKGMACSMAQPRLGAVYLTDAQTLQAAVLSERPDVRSLVGSCILLSPHAGNGRAPDLGEAAFAANAWRKMIRVLLDVRRRHSPFQFTPFCSFHEALNGWNRRLQNLAADVPANLRHHLAPFGQMPSKLAALFLQIDEYAGWEQQTGAAEAAMDITEWLAAQTLLCAADAHDVAQKVDREHAKAQMLAKIQANGPTAFWQLCRRFDVQNKAIRKPLLDELVAEGRVQVNSNGQLIAA